MGDVWVVRAGPGGRHAEAFERAGIVAVSVEGVPSIVGLTWEEVSAQATRQPGENPARARGHAAMLYRFANELKTGDLVLTPEPDGAGLLVGRLINDYEYREHAADGHRHVRRVEWLGHVSRSDLSQQARQTIGAPMAVFKPGAQAAIREALAALAR